MSRLKEDVICCSYIAMLSGFMVFTQDMLCKVSFKMASTSEKKPTKQNKKHQTPPKKPTQPPKIPAKQKGSKQSHKETTITLMQMLNKVAVKFSKYYSTCTQAVTKVIHEPHSIHLPYTFPFCNNLIPLLESPIPPTLGYFCFLDSLLQFL